MPTSKIAAHTYLMIDHQAKNIESIHIAEHRQLIEGYSVLFI